MSEKKYKVLIGDEVVAQEMTLDVVVILMKALFEENYIKPWMTVSISEMGRISSAEDLAKNRINPVT